MNEKKSEVDLACEILEGQQEPMYYLELIQEIGRRNGKVYGLDVINTIYTAINMDNRLDYQGDGYWFLTNYRGAPVPKKER